MCINLLKNVLPNFILLYEISRRLATIIKGTTFLNRMCPLHKFYKINQLSEGVG